MCGGVSSDGLDKIEWRFQDPEKVKRIEKMAIDHEKRVEETARVLQQKHRLEESSTNSMPEAPNSTDYSHIASRQVSTTYRDAF